MSIYVSTLIFAIRFSVVVIILFLQNNLLLAADIKAPIRIGTSLSLTGNYASFGKLFEGSYRLWEEEVNERGGILGRPVKLVIVDDKSDAASAVKIYEQFMEKDKLDLVIGPYSSPITAAVAPVAERNGYPMLAPGASSDKIWKNGYQYVFGVISPASRHMIGFFAVLTQAKINRVAVIAVDDEFSLSVAEGAKKWAPEYDITLTDFRVLPKKNPDLLSAAKAAQKSGAQALVMAGHFDESISMRRILKEIGWTPKAYYASTGPTVQKYLTTLGADAQGTFSNANWEAVEELRLPGSVKFLKAFQTRYGEKPTQHPAFAYAAGQILEQAIIKAGSVDRAAVRQALATIDINTLIGRYAVDRSGIQTKRFPLTVQWQGNKREIIWPEELRTAPPILNK